MLSGANAIVRRNGDQNVTMLHHAENRRREFLVGTGESCCPQPDRGNPAVRDETGGRRKLIEARNEAPACSDEEPVTATPRCPPMQRLRSIPTRMREIRPSGSVEGVASNRDPYSDFAYRTGIRISGFSVKIRVYLQTRHPGGKGIMPNENNVNSANGNESLDSRVTITANF